MQRDRATAVCCAYVKKFTVQLSALYFRQDIIRLCLLFIYDIYAADSVCRANNNGVGQF